MRKANEGVNVPHFIQADRKRGCRIYRKRSGEIHIDIFAVEGDVVEIGLYGSGFVFRQSEERRLGNACLFERRCVWRQGGVSL